MGKVKEHISVYKILNLFILTVGTAFIAMGLFLFLSPNTVAPGGVTGLAIVIKKMFGIKLYITNLVINVPLFLIGVYFLGGSFGLKTIYGTLSLSFWLWISGSVFQGYYLTNDILLAAIFGGVITGLGIGLVFRVGGTTGGTDLAGAILNNFFPSISTPKLMMIVDLIIVSIAGVVNNSVETSLYSVIALYLIIKVADFIIEGLDYSKKIYIVSEKSDEISDMILKELDRGVTALQGKGMYTKMPKDILMVVVTRAQVTKIKEIVSCIDPNAFVTISTTHEVLGEGFRSLRSKI